MLDKILKMFFAKETVSSTDDKITVIKKREVGDFREMIKKEISNDAKNPEMEETCLSGYFKNIQGLYAVDSERNAISLRNLR